ncbi:MAG: hypothetical protein C0505_09125 [Leptothrix sp. (in: Bacteria)]|nr:hypothetical protein [Leptothrix sp. (in: b-proteobacteria)]
MSTPPLTRTLRQAAAALVVVGIGLVVVLAVLDTQTPSGRFWTGVTALSAAVLVLVNFLLVWRLAHRLDETAARADAAAANQRELLDAMEAAVVVWGPDDRLVLCNRDFRSVYEPIADRLRPGMTFEGLLREVVAAGLAPQAQADPEAWIAQRVADHRQPGGPLLRQLPGGRWRRIVEQRLSDGSLLAHSVDVSDLMAAQAESARREKALTELNARLDAMNVELAHLSETDALTGLANRRHFDRRLAEECARAARHGLPLALLMFDVDYFKRYNDCHGHPAGDATLRRVAELLRSTARRPTDVVARIGGEEFAMLLLHPAAGEAQTQADRCLSAMDAAMLPHGDSPVAGHVTLSIGGVQVGQAEAGLDTEHLWAGADAALYQAKRAGRRRAVVRG